MSILHKCITRECVVNVCAFALQEKEATFNATIATLTEEKDKLLKDVEYKGNQIEGQKMVLTGLLNEAARQLQAVETEKIELETAKESAPPATASVSEPAPAEPEAKKVEPSPSVSKATPEKEAKEVLAEHDEVKKQVEEAAGTPGGLKAGVDEHYEKLKASHESLKTENSQLTRRVKKLKAQITTLEESAAAAAKLAAAQLAAKTKDPAPEPTKEQSPEEAKKPEPEPTQDPAPEEAKKPEPEPTKEQTPAAPVAVAAATVSVGISEAEKEKYQQQMHALEKQNKKLTEKLKAAKSEVKELLAAKGENTSLQQKLEVAVAEADGLRKRLAIRAEAPATGEADGEDARLRSEITLLEKELTGARVQLKDTQAEMSTAKLEYDKRELALNEKVEKLQTELASQKSAVVAVAPVNAGADTEALENELAAAKKQAKHEKKKVKILKSKITAAHHERDELQKKLEAFEKEKAAKLEATAAEMNGAQIELAATKEQIKTLSAEIEELKARLKARSTEGGVSLF